MHFLLWAGFQEKFSEKSVREHFFAEVRRRGLAVRVKETSPAEDLREQREEEKIGEEEPWVGEESPEKAIQKEKGNFRQVREEAQKGFVFFQD